MNPLRLNMANNTPSAHLTETIEIDGHTHDGWSNHSSTTASMSTSRIDCVEKEIMELFNEYNWVTIYSVTHNGEPIDFEYFAGEFMVFL